MIEVLKLDDTALDSSAGSQPPRSQPVNLRAGQYAICYGAMSHGESRLLQELTGELPVSGDSMLLGYPLRGMSRSRRRQILRQIGIIPCKLVAPPQSLSEFVSLPLQIAGLRTSQIDRKVREKLAEFGLTLFSRNQLEQLDADNLRLAYLAQALIKAPRLVLLEAMGDRFEASAVLPALRRYAEHGGAVLELRDKSAEEHARVSSDDAEERIYAAG